MVANLTHLLLLLATQCVQGPVHRLRGLQCFLSSSILDTINQSNHLERQHADRSSEATISLRGLLQLPQYCRFLAFA